MIHGAHISPYNRLAYSSDEDKGMQSGDDDRHVTIEIQTTEAGYVLHPGICCIPYNSAALKRPD